MEELLQQILQECRPYTGQGALASYIPELARQDPDRLGIAVFHKDGTLVEAGDSRRSFTIQSVMKPLSLLLALQDNGRETVRAHVGVEATGKPFDAINVADNALLAKHLNPMVNAGAILMCQLIGGETYDIGSSVCWTSSAAWRTMMRSPWTRRSITPKRPPAPKTGLWPIC